MSRYRPRILTPADARRVETELQDPQVRLAFLTFELLGLRMSELLSLRWKDIDFLNRRLRVTESKTDTGERSVSIPSPLLDEFMAHYQRTHYKADSNYAFCHPDKGSKWHPRKYRKAINAAVRRAGIQERFRPAHDLRVTSITSGVLANENPVKLMARAGHSDFRTTQVYIKLAGEGSPEEADALAALRLGTPVAQET